MRTRQSLSSFRVAGVFLAAGVLMLSCLGALAQPARLDDATRDKVWAIEAGTVAKSLELSAEQTTKLKDAYKAARESQRKAIESAATQQQGGRRDFRKMMEVNQAEKAKLETAMNAFLKPEQTAKALATLGTFSRRWDPMVAELDGMKLEAKASDAAMKLVADYVAESEKARQAGMTTRDEGMRDQLAKLKDKLDADLAKILSAEQLAKWKEATAARGGRTGTRGGAGGVGGGVRGGAAGARGGAGGVGTGPGGPPGPQGASATQPAAK